MSAGEWSGSEEFYVIFDSYDFTLSESERKAYAYDEDTSGLWYDADSDGNYNDDNGRDKWEKWWSYAFPEVYPHPKYILTQHTKIVFEKAIQTVSGKSTKNSAATEIFNFVNDYIVGSWTGGVGTGSKTTQYEKTVEEILKQPGTTIEGQCMDYGGVSVALYRAVGIPSRLASGMNVLDHADGNVWTHHIWAEVYESGTYHWSVYDSTAFPTHPDGVKDTCTNYNDILDRTLRDISHGIHLARGKNVGTTKNYLTVNISQGPISKRYVLVLESYLQQRSEDF